MMMARVYECDGYADTDGDGKSDGCNRERLKSQDFLTGDFENSVFLLFSIYYQKP